MPLKAINTTLIWFRILLTTYGAVALLYAFSYPYSVIPPSPEWDYVETLQPEHILKGLQAMAAVLAAPLTLVAPWVRIPVAEGLTPEHFTPWLWICPWLFMEFFSCLGNRRNFVWFTAMTATLVLALVAWPVLLATHPEYIHPAVPGDDGKLAEGLIKFGILFFFSILLRKIILDFLFHEPPQDTDNDLNYADADVLDPSKARTVREIAADTTKVHPKFLFGDADAGLIARFRLMMAKLGRRRAIMLLLGALGAVLLAGWVLVLYPQPDEREALQRDLGQMFAQSPLRTQDGLILATPQAVHAAYRVFCHMEEQEEPLFTGKDDSAVDAWLGLDKADPAYVRQMRSGDIVPNPRAIYMGDKEDRYLTLSDGTRAVTLVVRHVDGKISSVELQSAGWNPREDYKSWRKWRNIRASHKKD